MPTARPDCPICKRTYADHRDPDRPQHDLVHLLRQRICALAPGYQDPGGYDQLRSDQLLSAVVGKSDPIGEDRSRQRDQGQALARKSTLNRLERVPSEKTRHKKTTVDPRQVEPFFVETFLSAYEAEGLLPSNKSHSILTRPMIRCTESKRGGFFHSYYRHYCYLPLYVFCGDSCLAAVLRRVGNPVMERAKGSLYKQSLQAISTSNTARPLGFLGDSGHHQ